MSSWLANCGDAGRLCSSHAREAMSRKARKSSARSFVSELRETRFLSSAEVHVHVHGTQQTFPWQDPVVFLQILETFGPTKSWGDFTLVSLPLLAPAPSSPLALRDVPAHHQQPSLPSSARDAASAATRRPGPWSRKQQLPAGRYLWLRPCVSTAAAAAARQLAHLRLLSGRWHLWRQLWPARTSKLWRASLTQLCLLAAGRHIWRWRVGRRAAPAWSRPRGDGRG